MFKRCKVVMLPTNQKAENVILTGRYAVPHAEYHGNKYFTKAYLFDLGITANHLYILSDDEIKEGDWIIWFGKDNIPYLKQITDKRVFNNKTEFLCHSTYDMWIEEKYLSKVIATTDPSLKFADYYHNEERPKVNPKDNTITIRKIKDSWTREEVIELCRDAFYNDWLKIDFMFNEWLKENLT